MGSAEARKIIAEAMSDPDVYFAMAERENAVWGSILPALEVSDARAADAKASAVLGMGRHHGSLAKLMKDRGLDLERGLSLGCGAGRLERALVTTGVCRQMHGIDISDHAVQDARRLAEAEDLPITYQAADLNFIELKPATYDLVVAQTSLHHVLFLEHVAYQAWRSIRPGGYMWIHDFVGETQGQYAPKRLQIINELLSILPEKFRRNTINGRTPNKVVTPDVGRLGSPFEKIRSGDILPVFTTLFDIEWKSEFTVFLDLVAPTGTRAAFAENEDTRAIMEVLHLMEAVCLGEKIIDPVGGQYLLKPKPLSPATKFKEIFPVVPR